ncbi:hypothetical protein [Nocardia sp. BMG51109]|uniref:DUF7373 family lipoprotein n=1 Tax=Nocardia sp. BMG51109 TaxID=1056816 RepID=UPI0004638602|nr:hypothetical protein [Nocardia sp. BMG51109]
MNRLTRTLAAVALTFVVANTAACGSGEDHPPADPAVDLSRLNVGNNPTQPKEYGKATSLEQAKLLEAMRLGDHLPLPVEIDPAVKYAAPQADSLARTFISFDTQLYHALSPADANRLNGEVKGFLCGFATTGQTDPVADLSIGVSNLVMLFENEQNATEAADLMARADLESTPGTTPVGVGKYPAAHAQSTYPGELKSWYATGRYVIFSVAYDNVMGQFEKADLSRATPYVEKSIEANTRAVQSFTPTPSDQLLQLDVDPDRMLGRALPTVTVDQSQRGIPGRYDRHGGLQFSADPQEDTPLFEETGVDRISWNGGFVYRARDAAGARRIAELKSAPSKQLRTVEAPKELPAARCLGLKVPSQYSINYYCTVSFDRYAARVAANQLADVHQRISAQYALLANGR